MSSQLAIFSHVAIDAVRLPGSKGITEAVGGAGAYAAVGAALASTDGGDPLLVAGVGETQRLFFEKWCGDRGIASGALFRVPYSVPITLVEYRDEQNRREIPLLGLKHFEDATPLPNRVTDAQFDDVTYAFVFHDEDPEFWRQMRDWSERVGVKVGWELSLDACKSSKLAAVKDISSGCEVIFLNLEESELLLGTHDEEQISKAFSEFETTVVLHDASRPVRVWSHGEYFEVPVVRGVNAIDPTGGGNSFCGAILERLKTGDDLRAAVEYGCAVAAFVVSVRGVPVNDSENVKCIRAMRATLTQ
ncbi:PfkB family carbohydrate kinase [Actinomyces sp.]|uniref:carbohydrate kinase family protein n=1 Tax=Actinomyces sp. TaxID=29317 RepID=UPI00290DF800|nr:PfkB family carbohydrate kinase [Actinomyces sp.]MDU5569384.1 PfkB family carbohydrate kinase [Actinomyces sp.]MDU7239663.1 PfkB family carbohydrate kinase [Actinomyces sp.]